MALRFLRPTGHPAPPGPGDQRSTDIAAITLAECLCSVRGECVDHVVVFGERYFRHLLFVYKNYYSVTHTTCP
jgi:hypothetical protein